MQTLTLNRPSLPPVFTAYPIAKRLMDLSLALLALPFALVLGLLCALAILVQSGRPIFFVQDRIGRGGRRFRIYKFRTMPAGLDDHLHRQFMAAFVKGQPNISRNG